MRKKDLLVTGTDTGVGKTFIAAALIRALRETGENAIGFKAAETGIEEGALSDSEILREASGIDEPLARPLLRLTEPLTPALAAERAGLEFPLGPVVDRVEALRKAGYRVVLEGAGGLLSPMGWDWNIRDLAKELDLEVVIVARAGLGTLNHVLLTVQALRAGGVSVGGVVLDGGNAEPQLAEQTNPEVLSRLLPGIPLASVPWYPGAGAVEGNAHAVPSLRPICTGIAVGRRATAGRDASAESGIRTSPEG